MSKYLISIGGARTHSHPEVEAMADDETLEETLNIIAQDHSEHLDDMHVWKLTAVTITAKAFAIKGLDKLNKDPK